MLSSPMSEFIPVFLCFLYATSSNARDWRGGFASLGRTDPTFTYAHCELQPTTEVVDHRAEQITGRIEFRQPLAVFTRGWLEVRVHIEGLPLDDGILNYGLHVHEFGDLRDGCESTGGHYNPYGNEHGGPTVENRHAGDFGNVVKNRAGGVSKYFLDRVASLTGPYSIVGRSIVLKAREDDLGLGGNPSSRVTGSSGGRVACCVIGHSNGQSWRGSTI
ncbi:uncharacterized protein LOC135471501 [Liolophura sinensis]|uniref:uncharacterized protein LOC135471501 n=1 Tax=Liolophura sinensis TaxID=3198878 RepID=UPI003158E1D9